MCLLLITICYSQLKELSESEISDKYDDIETNDLRFKNIKEVKELYEYSKVRKYKYGVLKGAVALQRHYLFESNYTLSLNYGKEAEEIATKIKNYQILTSACMYQGDAYTKLGMKQEAEDYLNLSLRYDEKIENVADRHMWLSAIYTVFAALYSDKKDYNSVISYYHQALNVIESTPRDHLTELQAVRYFYLLIFHNMNLGNSYAFYSIPPNLDEAEKYFLKTLKFSESHPKEFKMTAINVYYSVAYFYYIKKDYSKCIVYSEKLLEVEKYRKNPEIRLFAYENLKESYDALNNLPEQNKYLKLYSQLSDSLANVKKGSVILHSEDQSVKSNEEISTLKKILLSSLVIAGMVILMVGIYFYERNKILKKKYFLLIEKLDKNKGQEFTATKRIYGNSNEVYVNSNIPLHKEDNIIKKIEAFENSEKFLRKNITLPYISHLLNINPRYLSITINKVKNKNFNDYINELRIKYIIDKLYNNPLYREYKISYLAEECGYSSHQVFITAFRKETGMTPSYFIKQLSIKQRIKD
ncbi:helix-turn-helix transcriptional regulator [Elizabethkingia anophelis]|uniref:helix-turn-helix transcriptional regulator n=1 Tax=Elizabethkingia anophelis TaxID=1117645 RepID=UPI00259B8E10|nr:helix-turn-helix transcriptional regulator [Elizabethkingia anophelis]WJK01307.1 helix-turn-helix transcriptional regulator [Elizabethkingia anophelis]